MRIRVQRSGGFAGVLLNAEVNTEQLPAEQARAYEDLVRQANFFSLPARTSPRPGGADRFQYEVEVVEGGAQRTIRVGDADLPEVLRPLIERLIGVAKGQDPA